MVTTPYRVHLKRVTGQIFTQPRAQRLSIVKNAAVGAGSGLRSSRLRVGAAAWSEGASRQAQRVGAARAVAREGVSAARSAAWRARRMAAAMAAPTAASRAMPSTDLH